MKFSKWHGLGNDYLLVERAELATPLTADAVRRICDYHFGVGSDGILEVVSADELEAEVVVWNPDGSTAELSGNGTRIAARWLARLSGADEVRIRVGDREVVARMQDGPQVEMDMGEVDVGETETIDVAGEQVELTPVSVGNPHAVIRRDPGREELLRLGPLVETHERFPNRTNVQLVRVDGAHELTVGVWERGAGETLASGTSSMAAVAAAVANGWCESPVTVHLAGGDLLVELEDGRARLTGPAEEIFTGQLSTEMELRIGDPDLPTPEPVIEAAARALQDPANHGYPTNHGTQAFREAAADFYRARFGVELDPDTEIVPVLGGKEGVNHICLACLDPGDICLSPDPGYPPYTSGPLFAGAEVHYLPLAEENGFLPDLDSIPEDTLSRANLLFVDYPNNPTGAVVTEGYFERVVEFARTNELIVVHDNAYSEICFDGYLAPSFLETAGAREVGVELFSPSKGWNMTGWRGGLVAGNAELCDRYRGMKANIDSGMFGAIQAAVVAALTVARDFPREMSEVYRRRRDLLSQALRAISLEVTPPTATPYFWVRVPEGYTSGSFAELVLERAAVVVSPGSAYGPSGEGFVRMSLTVTDERLEEAAQRIESALAGATSSRPAS